MSTLTDVYEKQVLDNVAMFCNNPSATPFFANVTSGSVSVNDSMGANGSLFWDATTFVQGTFGPTMQRSFGNNWTAVPVNDHTRLKLMRCAYQKAIGCASYDNGSCPNCCVLARRWHAPAELDGASTTPSAADALGREIGQQDCNVSCAPGCNWFCVGKKCDVPRDCCSMVGEHCGTYVWVEPSGRSALHRLTMLILEYAAGSAHEPTTQKVERKWSFGKDNYPVLCEVVVTSNEVADSLVATEDVINTQRAIEDERRRLVIDEELARIKRLEDRTDITAEPETARAALRDLKNRLEEERKTINARRIPARRLPAVSSPLRVAPPARAVVDPGLLIPVPTPLPAPATTVIP